jgi:hypothetical protein
VPDSEGCGDAGKCGAAETCIKSHCVPCSKLLEACSSCAQGTQPSKIAVGACVTCECLPQCKVHSDCGVAMICAGGSCVECKKLGVAKCPADCPFGFMPQAVQHNGCSVCECAPANQCTRDADCASGQVCYAGAQCDDGCKDASCCHGNLCSEPGCKPTSSSDMSCTLVGCAAGECLGDVSCAPASCRCAIASGAKTPTGWECTPSCDAKCGANF